MKSAAFRVDSGFAFGTGHVKRCATLATSLRDRGVDVSFVCRRHARATLDRIRSLGFPVHELPSPPMPQLGSDSASWNGVSETQDASDTIEKLPCNLDWLIVDHYSCGHAWELAVRPYCERLAVIDDLARLHDCDLLIDPSWVGDATTTRYDPSSDSVTEMLLGPSYAFISSDYLAYRDNARERNEPVKRILVYFGGSDIANLTPLTLRVLTAHAFSHLAVDVVIGSTAGNKDGMKPYGSIGERTYVHRHLPSLAPLLASADLAIGAVGGTTWERMCLGVPTIAVILADNQRQTGKSLAAADLLCLLGEANSVNGAALAAALSSLLGDPVRRQRMADECRTLVDGEGVNRIVKTMSELL